MIANLLVHFLGCIALNISLDDLCDDELMDEEFVVDRDPPPNNLENLREYGSFSFLEDALNSVKKLVLLDNSQNKVK